MKALRVLGMFLMAFWMLNGASHVLVMPFLEPERVAFHMIGGVIQCGIAWYVFSRLSSGGKTETP